jgi:putative aldouronate transport system substrate-binding protein
LDSLNSRYPSDESLDDNRWTRLYEKELGIKLYWKWKTPSWEAYQQKMLMAITGESSDLMYVEGANMMQYLVNANLVEDLKDYIPWLVPETRRYIASMPGAVDVSSLSGRLYALCLGKFQYTNTRTSCGIARTGLRVSGFRYPRHWTIP